MGNGRGIKCWQDVWCDDTSLKDSCPSLFSFASSKETWMDDVLVVEGRLHNKIPYLP